MMARGVLLGAWIDDELDAAAWTQLRRVAAERMVAIELDDSSARVVESCRVPGRYREVVAAPESPGRGWAADRLVFTPDEPRGCVGATHFVASFTADEHGTGAAIVLPLPCPRIGAGVPDYCIGAGPQLWVGAGRLVFGLG